MSSVLSGITRVDISRLKKLHLISKIQNSTYSTYWWMYMINYGIINVIDSRPILTNKGEKIIKEYEVEEFKRKELSKQREKLKRQLVRLVVGGKFEIIELKADVHITMIIATSIGKYQIDIYSGISGMIDFVNIEKIVYMNTKIGKQILQALEQKILEKYPLFYVKHSNVFNNWK